MNQTETAESLLEEFDISGHDNDISILDLLDCLACAGLKLVEDNDNAASLEYGQKLESVLD